MSVPALLTNPVAIEFDVIDHVATVTLNRPEALNSFNEQMATEVVPDDQLRARAAELATEIAARRPQGVQGTVRALWEARDLTPSLRQRHGLSYTHIGNAGPGRTESRTNKRTARTR